MRTVLGAFDDSHVARQAITRFVLAGWSRDDVHLQPEAHEYAALPETAREGERPSIASFFARLLATPTLPGAPGTYRDAVRRGSAVVVVHVADSAGADAAAELMFQFGAFDVELRAPRQ